MDFTHINVSKYNYCFSDYPFPDETSDYPHHSEMLKYVRSYADKHRIIEKIKFKTQVLNIEGIRFSIKIETNKKN
jgi:dimethylaniline monooxygenase (N-oxide forming)